MFVLKRNGEGRREGREEKMQMVKGHSVKWLSSRIIFKKKILMQISSVRCVSEVEIKRIQVFHVSFSQSIEPLLLIAHCCPVTD